MTTPFTEEDFNSLTGEAKLKLLLNFDENLYLTLSAIATTHNIEDDTLFEDFISYVSTDLWKDYWKTLEGGLGEGEVEALADSLFKVIAMETKCFGIIEKKAMHFINSMDGSPDDLH